MSNMSLIYSIWGREQRTQYVPEFPIIDDPIVVVVELFDHPRQGVIPDYDGANVPAVTAPGTDGVRHLALRLAYLVPDPPEVVQSDTSLATAVERPEVRPRLPVLPIPTACVVPPSHQHPSRQSQIYHRRFMPPPPVVVVVVVVVVEIGIGAPPPSRSHILLAEIRSVPSDLIDRNAQSERHRRDNERRGVEAPGRRRVEHPQRGPDRLAPEKGEPIGRRRRLFARR